MRLKEATIQNLRERTKELDELFIGDGVTVSGYSDRQAHTLIDRPRRGVMTIARDDTKLDPNGPKPEFIPGGFAARCMNQSEVKWLCTPNPNGARMTLTRRTIDLGGGETVGVWVPRGTPTRGNLTQVRAGRHEYYDYNF